MKMEVVSTFLDQRAEALSSNDAIVFPLGAHAQGKRESEIWLLLAWTNHEKLEAHWLLPLAKCLAANRN